ncbi:DUF4384 domain-containing protein [Desulfobacterales bacterium HSG16]|nr:DUF4384 domain-containing protein [Desulfobacterales bacterium HSG16]
MKFYRILFPCTVMIVFSAFFMICSNPVFSENLEKEKVCFRWAFAAIKGPLNSPEFVAVTKDISLETGDRLKFFIQLQTECFVYLFYRSSKNEMVMLFPNKGKKSKTKSKTFQKYYIPRGQALFKLDENTGTETFYLLASNQRLKSLETLYNQYQAAKISQKDEIAGRIIAKIRKIKKDRIIRRAKAERPVSIAGSLRDPSKDIIAWLAQVAEKISTKNFYTRTITIEHK